MCSKRNIILIMIMFIACSGVYGRSSLTATGSLYSEIQHTPEQKWEAWHRFQLVQELNFTGDLTVYANLGGWTPRFYEKHSFPDYQPKAQFALNRIYAKLKGPVLTGGEPIQIGFGDLAIAYSPYSVWLNRWDKSNILTNDEWIDPAINYNMVRRGVSVEEVSLLGNDISAFYLWDGLGEDDEGSPIPYPYRTAFGTKLDNRFFSVVLSQYLDAEKSEDSTADELIFEDQYLEEDRVYELAIKEFEAGPFLVDGTFASHLNANQGVESKGELALVNLSFPLGENIELLGKYYNYGQNFSPKYRDRTPRFDPHTGAKLSWNELDRYRGQKGSAFGIRTTQDSLQMTVLARKFIKNADNAFDAIEAEGNINTTRLKLRGVLNLTKEYCKPNQFGTELTVLWHEARLESSFLLKKFNNLDFFLTGYYHDKKDEYNENEFSYGVKFAVREGSFEGLNLGVNKRNLDGLMQDRVSLEYRMPLGLVLIANYATPNFVEEGEYDRGGEKIIRDNCIKLISEIKF